MKKIATILLVALATGCVTKPVQVSALTILPVDSVFACVFKQVNDRGYTVTSSDKSAGFLTAEKQTRAKSLGLVGTKTNSDRLTVSIYSADGATRNIKIAASSDREELSFVGTQKRGARPSEQVQADADSVVSVCKKSAVSKATGPGLEPMLR